MVIKKKTRLLTILLFASVVAFAGLTAVDMSDTFYGGNQADDSRNLQNAGHIFTLQSGLPYNAGDLIVVTWRNGVMSLHVNNGLSSLMWSQIGPSWTSGEEPPEEVCDEDSNVPGCSPPSDPDTVATVTNCVGNSTSYALSFYNSNPSNPVSSFNVERLWGGSWDPWYDGSSTCIFTQVSGSGVHFRVMAQNAAGDSNWVNVHLPNDCSAGGGQM